MCGLAGFLDASPSMNEDQMRATVQCMADTLHHRGPDDGAVWVEPKSGIALGFRRLSIIDLSPEGRQPMHSHDGRYVIVFNGEIYNFQELREELLSSGHSFRGRSDTEVMLTAFVQWGVEETLTRLNGMFAIALWDNRDKVLHLIRDRMGKKPLYYGRMGTTILFGSELKALKAHPAWRGEINRPALALFLKHTYVPAPHSIYLGIYKLPAGCWLSMRAENPDLPQPKTYWSITEIAAKSGSSQFDGSEPELLDSLESILKDAVARRMVADVPLGAFLSGGTDSATVVSLMQASSTRRIRTFTVGFHDHQYDEASHARAVARHLGTDHTEIYVSPQECMQVIPRIPTLYDEPFADSSQIPTYLISRLARKDVTVCLSGDGGDELFGGYGRYVLAQDLWRKLRRVPRRIRLSAVPALRALCTKRPISPLIGDRVTPRFSSRRSGWGQRLELLTEVAAAESSDRLYLDLCSHWKNPQEVVLGANGMNRHSEDMPSVGENLLSRMMLHDAMTYLPDDILVKVDRASMAVSLEVRNPLLDYRIFEFAGRIPIDMKIRVGRGKWVLRRLLQRYLPIELVERPKMGFDVPIANWLRGPLREQAESVFNESALAKDGFFNPEPIRRKWLEHLSGRRNWQHHLWCIVVFHAWLQAQKSETHRLAAM